jgi:ribonucleoside-diphosphate reductase alpha chain
MAQVMARTTFPQETLDAFPWDQYQKQPVQAQVFWDKYALRDEANRQIEITPRQMWSRIATAAASVEKEPEKWVDRFFDLLRDWRFVPGGRINFGLGNPRKVTPLNCYVLPIKADSIDGIFDCGKEMAKTYAGGGGVGTDVSVLRPLGGRVNNSALETTGPTSFMDYYSIITNLIGQNNRRGALMLTMADWHPDVFAFCRVKRDMKTVRFANISVRVSDELMQSVRDNAEWDLVFPDFASFSDDERDEKYTQVWTGDIHVWIKSGGPIRHYGWDSERKIIVPDGTPVLARELFEELVKNAWEFAEPGTLYWGRIKSMSTSEYNGMGVLTTNPCGEIPLPPYDCCDLGHVNLSLAVRGSFTPQARIDWEWIDETVQLGVRFLDNVLTYSEKRHPLTEQAEASLRGRRIGLGTTGLGDILTRLGIPYDSDEGIELADKLYSRIKNTAYNESVNLAEEKGAFPSFDRVQHFYRDSKPHPFLGSLNNLIFQGAYDRGLRNVALLTVAPVGSGATMLGVTSGIEPMYDFSYTRHSESLSVEWFRMIHPLVLEYLQWKGIEIPPEEATPDQIAAMKDEQRAAYDMAYNRRLEKLLPTTWTTAFSAKPEQRVRMQATIQKHIDHSISSTVNLPEDIGLETVKEIFLKAWEMGCKGITVYREGSREGVLISDQKMGADKAPAETTAVPVHSRIDEDGYVQLHDTPDAMPGNRYRVETPRGRNYIACYRDPAWGNRLAEIFVKGPDEEAAGFARIITTALRAPVDPREIIEQLWKESTSADPTLVTSPDGKHRVWVRSLLQGIALAMGWDLYGYHFRPDRYFPHATSLPRPGEPLVYDNHHNGQAAEVATSGVVVVSEHVAKFTPCPRCGARTTMREGCLKCTRCDYEKCA